MPNKSSSAGLQARLDEEEGAREAERLEAPRFHKPAGWQGHVVLVIAACFSLFQLYTAAFGLFEQFLQRTTHLAFGLALIGLTYRLSRTGPGGQPPPVRLWDWAFLALGALSCLYIPLNFERLLNRIAYFDPLSSLDLVVSAVLVLLVVEACRRVVSPALALITLICLAYGLFGHLIPGRFGHPYISLEEMLETLYLSGQGIFGIPIGVSATYVYIYILFGGFIMRLGLMQLFADVAIAAAGATRGGPAKVSVLCSALFGTISGSGIANAITTGNFTIPLMKRVGYPGHFAAGVEASSSMGGNLMPPIMGAAAFIMADFLGVPYQDVVLAALIPAVLYFFGIAAMVHLKACRLDMPRLPRDQMPDLRNTLLRRGHLLLPVVALLYFLLTGWSVMFAGVAAIVAAVVVSFLNRETWLTPRRIVEILEWGALTALPVIAACATVGIIIGVVAQTGFAVKMTSAILTYSGGYFVLTLFFAMIASLVLGLGLPTTPTYIITAALCAPALVKFGVAPITAHLFVLYYGILADITPPTAIAPYALAGIAGSDPNRTCWSACMLALPGFIVPFAFAYDPVMLDPLLREPESTLIGLVTTTASAFLGVYMLSAALIGWMFTHAGIVPRVVLLAGAFTLILPGIVSDLLGLGLLGLAIAWQSVVRRREVGDAPSR